MSAGPRRAAAVSRTKRFPRPVGSRRAASASRALGALAASALSFALACSGEGFTFSPAPEREEPPSGVDEPPASEGEEPVVGDDPATSADGLPPVDAPPQSPPEPDAEEPASTPADAGAEPPAEEPPTTACGVARVPTPGLFDDEVCLGPAELDVGSAEPNLGGNFADHQPPHRVRLSAFFIDAYEVTVARFRACVEAGACDEPRGSGEPGCTYTPQPGGFDAHPVTCVTWTAADAFCAFDGRRLPTEAEWELAARGTRGSVYPWGDDFDCNRAVLAGNGECPQHAGTTPRRVGSAPRGASPEGVFDLVGNAWEWVHDRAGAYPSGPVDDPQGPTSGSTRVQRGGNWLSLPSAARAYLRSSQLPGASGTFSFRCARSAAP